MTREQYDILKEFEPIFNAVVKGGRPGQLTSDQVAKINPIGMKLIGDKYSGCAVCGSGRLRFLKRLGRKFFQYKKDYINDQID